MLSRREKKRVDEFFYKKLDMLSKMSHIKTVIDSCTTSEQLRNAIDWARKIMFDIEGSIPSGFSFSAKLYLCELFSNALRDILEFHKKALANV